MKSTNWKDIVELIGFAAIVGSLIFVGLQMKQSQEIALSDAYQARSESSIALALAQLESPELLSALTKRSQGEQQNLSAEEITALNGYISAQLIYIENVLYQYENGFVPRDSWESNYAWLKRIMSDPTQKERILRARNAASMSFYREIERAAAELEAEQ